MMRNLHAHACRGIIMHWAPLRWPGNGHINNHSPKYLLDLFLGLGYRVNQTLTDQLRVHNPNTFNDTAFDYQWFRKPTTFAFERIEPLPGCRTRVRTLDQDRIPTNTPFV